MPDPAPRSVPPHPPKTRSGSETRQRTPLLHFRVTEAERAAIRSAAEAAGLTVGSYIRTRLLTAPATRTVRRPPVEHQTLARLLGLLGRVGGNVHQITRRLNFGDSVPRPELDAALTAFREAADAILQALGRRPHDY